MQAVTEKSSVRLQAKIVRYRCYDVLFCGDAREMLTEICFI